MTTEKPPASGWMYMWDPQNRLKQVTKNGVTTTFTYRSDGLRASKTVSGVTTNYVYDGQTVIGETRSDGTSSWYTPGANGYISRTDLDSAGNVTNKEWFVYDGLGSCRALVKPNAQGTEAVLVARYDYDVYGAVRTQSGSTENKFKYVASIGHPTDEETGLLYMRARYYDPQTGRFVSEDPGMHDDNWYVYCQSNPINRIDQSGEEAAAIWWLLGVAFTLYALGWYGASRAALTDPFVKRYTNMSIAASTVAALFFAFAAIDSGISGVGAYVTGILDALGSGLGYAVATIIAQGRELMQSAASGFARAAIIANIVNGVMIAGYIASIGVDAQQ